MSATTMLYVAEHKRKTTAGLLAGALTLAIGFGIGRLTDPSSADLTPQLAAARQLAVREHATTVAAGGELASAQRAITQLRSTIAGQQAQIVLLERSRPYRTAPQRTRHH